MQATLEEYAKDFVAKNYRDVSGGYADVDLDLTITGQSIKIDATLQFPMTVMRLAGVETMSLKASSTIQKAMKPIELALVLDTTGSMKNDMSGLKNAANSLLAKLYADGSSKNMRSEYIRASLVPFSAAVRLDTSAYDFNLGWIDTTGTNPLSKVNFTDATWNNYIAVVESQEHARLPPHSWNGCVEARTHRHLAPTTSLQLTLRPSTTDAHSKFPAFFNPDSPSFYIGSNSQQIPEQQRQRRNGHLEQHLHSRLSQITLPRRDTSSAWHQSGSRRTGYDDSVIGNNEHVF